MNKKDMDLIQEKIGYSFANQDLLRQAFVRKTYAKENGGADNEVLELIGDSILGTLCLKKLIGESGKISKGNGALKEFVCHYSESDLTKKRTNMVDKEALSSLMDRLGLNRFLLVGKGDLKLKVAQQPSVKEDLFEAIIGAITIDCNWDFKKLEKIVLNLIHNDSISHLAEKKNYVELIQQWFQKKYGRLPKYEYIKYDLRDDIIEKIAKEIEFDKNLSASNSRFYCQLFIGNTQVYVLGTGSSQSKAQKNACVAAYRYLKLEQFSEVRAEFPEPKLSESTAQLKMLVDKGYVSKPTYSEKNKFDKDGRTIWCVECVLKGKSFKGEAFQKKEAKRIASYNALKSLLK